MGVLAVLFLIGGLGYLIVRHLIVKGFIKNLTDKITNKVFRRVGAFLIDEQTSQYIIGFIIAFAGVLLAITLTNMDSDNRDRARAINLLEVAVEDISDTTIFLGQHYDGIGYYLDEPPLPTPIAIHDIFRNEIVITNISAISYTLINREIRGLDFSIVTYEHATDVDVQRELIYVISNSLELLRQYIENEIDYLNGEIRLAKLEHRQREALNIATENLNAIIANE